MQSLLMDPHWNAAQMSFQSGALEPARDACMRVLAIEPLHSGAHLMLANISSSLGMHQLATAHAMRAAQRMGKQTLKHVAGVALKLISVGEYGSAVALIRKVDPDRVPSPSSLAEFSQQLSLMEQHDDALRYMDAAIAQGLDADWVHYVHGNYLKFVGRLDAAAEAYERSLALNPDFSFSHHALAYLGGAGSAARVDRVRASIQSVGSAFRDMAYLQYALFKELDGLGDTDAAWTALEAGFRDKRGRLNHSAREETSVFDDIIAATREGFDTPAVADDGRATPVFVLGMPRTGTTLLERVLGGHARVALCGELNDFRMQFKWVSNYYCVGFFDAVATSRIASANYPQLGQRYLDQVAWRVPAGASHFTDKNPGNFMMAGLVLRALPQARIIHLKRNAMDSCFSNLKELFGSNAHPYSYDFSDLATHYRNYTRLMAHWHQVNPGRILDVNYEDLVSDPDSTARRITEFCGLDYQPAQIRVESNAAPV
ncbi:MAG: sulfotransferase, partial [Frankiaceae bacterium]|nr:sulfotransferase [Arenimonas sp.]